MTKPDKIWSTEFGDLYLLSTPAREHAEELVEVLDDAGRKLLAYVGVCKGDKELTGAILPKIHDLLAKIKEQTDE